MRRYGFILAGIIASLIIGVSISEAADSFILLEACQFDTKNGEPELFSFLKSTPAPDYDYYLVQCRGPILKEWKEEIKSAGCQVLGYIPNYAYLVRMNESVRFRIESLSFIGWVGLWQPGYKISPRLTSKEAPLKVTILLFPGENLPVTASEIQNMGATILRTSDSEAFKIIEAELSSDLLVPIASMRAVQWIEPIYPLYWHNDLSARSIQGGLATADTSIWRKGLRGDGIILSTSDSGINTAHWQFYDAAYPISTFGNYASHRKVIAYVDGSLGGGAVVGDYAGSSYHGTHTAGTACGQDAYNGGTSIYDGIAKNAKIYFADIGSATGLVVPADLTNLYLLPYNGNLAGVARIMSNSWGYDSEGDYILQDAQTDNFMWNRKNFLIIVSQGNDPPNTYVGSCGVSKNVIAVGSTQGTDATLIVSYLTEGPADDLRKKPELMAMGGSGLAGSSIMSADGATSGATSNYKELSGTSMAAPAVNGACALIRQYLTEGWYPTGLKVPANAISNPSAALMKSLALGSTDPNIGTLSMPNDTAGWGRMDLDSVLYFSGDVRKLALHDSATGGLNTGDSTVYYWNVITAIPLRLVLCWTDTAGNPAVIARNQVNDLDLTVIDPASTTYLGNVWSVGQSATGGLRDSLNVSEHFRRNAPALGAWRAIVKGRNVPTGANQPYALTVTGDITSTAFPYAVHFTGMNLMASSGGVNLTWRTESEQDCYQWEIERSDNPEQGFVQVGKVDGGGTTNQPQDYNYTDNTITEKGEYYYRLAEIGTQGERTYYGPMSITFGGNVPTAYMLAQSIPNPARGGLSISFALRKGGATSLKIYNITGQVVRMLDNGYRMAGVYSIPWDGKDDQGKKVSNGIYLYRLISGDFQATRKITILR